MPIEPETFKGSQKSLKLINFYVFDVLTKYLANESFDVDDIKEKVTEISSKRSDISEKIVFLNSICDLAVGKYNNYFDLAKPNTKLEKIQNNFFAAKSAILNHQLDVAKMNFQEISRENSELYYIREAKNFLEEN